MGLPLDLPWGLGVGATCFLKHVGSVAAWSSCELTSWWTEQTVQGGMDAGSACPLDEESCTVSSQAI